MHIIPVVQYIAVQGKQTKIFGLGMLWWLRHRSFRRLFGALSLALASRRVPCQASGLQALASQGAKVGQQSMQVHAECGLHTAHKMAPRAPATVKKALLSTY